MYVSHNNIILIIKKILNKNNIGKNDCISELLNSIKTNKNEIEIYNSEIDLTDVTKTNNFLLNNFYIGEGKIIKEEDIIKKIKYLPQKNMVNIFFYNRGPMVVDPKKIKIKMKKITLEKLIKNF